MKFKIFNVIILGTLLVGCSTQTETKENNTVENIAENESIVVEHAFGETVINEKPERVTAIAWGNGDVSLALGVIPIGMPSANWGEVDENGLAPWTVQRLEELGGELPVIFDETDGIDFEAVADTSPDVILASYSGLTKEDYDLLSEIAPVVAYPTNPWQTYWREQIIMDATGMGLEAEGIQLVANLENLIDEKVSSHPSLENKTAMFAWFNISDLSSIGVYLPSDPRAAYLIDLGFEFSEPVNKLVEDQTSFYTQISSEYADSFSDVDVIVTYGDENTLKALQEDALLGTIPAIKRGSVVLLEDGTAISGASTPSALSIPYVIDEYLDLFEKAVSKINE